MRLGRISLFLVYNCICCELWILAIPPPRFTETLDGERSFLFDRDNPAENSIPCDTVGPIEVPRWRDGRRLSFFAGCGGRQPLWMTVFNWYDDFEYV